MKTYIVRAAAESVAESETPETGPGGYGERALSRPIMRYRNDSWRGRTGLEYARSVPPRTSSERQPLFDITTFPARHYTDSAIVSAAGGKRRQ